MHVEFAIHDGERVLVILREEWRVLIERPDGRRQWIEPHTLKPEKERETSKSEGMPPGTT